MAIFVSQKRSERTNFKILLLVLGLAVCTVFGTFTGCGPSIKGSIPIPAISINKDPNPSSRNSGNTYLFVDEFIDARGSKTIALVDGKNEVQSTGEVVPPVVKGLKDALGNSGFSFSDSAPVVLSGELRKWNADVSGRMPTKIKSEAQLFVEVLDPANKKIYSGTYNGFSSVESGSVAEPEVQKALSSAMEEAIKQVTNDRQLIGLLQSY